VKGYRRLRLLALSLVSYSYLVVVEARGDLFGGLATKVAVYDPSQYFLPPVEIAGFLPAVDVGVKVFWFCFWFHFCFLTGVTQLRLPLDRCRGTQNRTNNLEKCVDGDR
jgi:hypothetical protein